MQGFFDSPYLRDFVFGGRWWQAIDQKVRPGKYDWSAYPPLKKLSYVKNALVSAVQLVTSGQATDVESVLQNAIAQVEIDESWDVWKNRNSNFVAMMKEAQHEADLVNSLQRKMQSGEPVSEHIINSFHFKYITPETLTNLLYAAAPATNINTTAIQSKSAAFGSGIVDLVKQNPIPAAIVGGLLVIGIIAFRPRNNQGLSNIQNKQLK